MNLTTELNLPLKLVFGKGVFNLLGREAAIFGKKAFLVTGGSSAKKSGALDKALNFLKNENIESIVFDKVLPNPTTAIVYEGTEALKKEKCDFVIGLGGGSILDCAKAIAFAVKNDGDIMDYVYGRKPAGEALPVVLIPTTCGTGSEGNGFAVLTDIKTNDKKSLRCNSIVPKVSIVDPDLMKTMPKKILASVGFDALCHCIEAYISAIGTTKTSLISLIGIKLISESLIILYDGKGSDKDWENLSRASTIGGMVIGIAGVTAAHGLEHPASGLRNIVHGEGLCALTPIICKKSIAVAPQKFAEIAKNLGAKDETELVEKIEMLIDRLNLPKNLSSQGIKREDVEWMSENALKVSAAGLKNHPAQFGIDEIKEIYYSAL
ncbi:MAG: iron-containing alcohol dehydrogenase [Elusimicrobiota bacterium]|jgi:alcohol dehydrogenase class IV|nr:iron-containing alcohol dehydrogenase [Elusimicrobiota bacterium]